MSHPASTKECLVEGLRLIRSNRSQEALPFLEAAVRDSSLRYAPSVLRVAQAITKGIETVDICHDGKDFRVCLNQGNIGLDIHHIDGNFFESEELSYCRKIVGARSTIVDVGANTGNHLIFFQGFLKPNLLIPVEPVPKAVEALKRNLELNNMTVDCRGLGLAAGKEAGELVLNLEAGADLVVASVKENQTDSSQSKIPSVKLDDLIPEKIDFLKIDVEGFEKNVLAGSHRILSEDKPTIMIEMHDKFRDELISILQKYHYHSIREFSGIGYKNVICRVQ